MKLTSKNVEDVISACFYDDISDASEVPEEAIVVQGIIGVSIVTSSISLS